VVECRTCNREVTGLGRGYFTPRSTQPSIPPGSVNEYQLRLRRLIRHADETQGVQVKLWYPLTMRAVPECLRYALCGGAIQIDYLCFFKYLWALRLIISTVTWSLLSVQTHTVVLLWFNDYKHSISVWVPAAADREDSKKTWWDCVKNDMESLGLSQKDAQSRNKWRRRIKGATG